MMLKACLLAVTPAILLAQTDSERLAALNKQADSYLSAYDLDKAEPLLEEALDVASRMGSSVEGSAHAKLYDLYIELHKRDGQGWRSIAVPHLLKAIEFLKDAPAGRVNQLASKYALVSMRIVGKESKADVAVRFEKFLTQWVFEIEAGKGPVNPETAVAYEALANFPDGSPGQLQALNACNLLSDLHPQGAEHWFTALLVECAEASSRTKAYSDAIRLAEFARRTAAASASHYRSEAARSYIVEAESETAKGNYTAALAAIKQADDRAKQAAAPANDLWERMLKARLEALTALHDSAGVSQTKRDLKTWRAQKRSETRIQMAKALKTVEPSFTGQALAQHVQGTTVALILINVDGTPKVVSMFRPLPLGLTASAEKAVGQWKFRPYLLDGKPVAGTATIEINFRVAN